MGRHTISSTNPNGFGGLKTRIPQGREKEDLISTECFVGIDVSKDKLDIDVYTTEKFFCVSNNQSGLDKLIKKIQDNQPELIVLESTGGYETFAASTLHVAGLPVVIINARQIRDFAKSVGKLAKTDAIDALVIARFAKAVRPEVRPLKDSINQELTALVTRRRQIVDMIVAETNRLATAAKRNRRDIQDHHSTQCAAKRSAELRRRYPGVCA